MNNFQTILIAIFIAFFIFAVLIFSGIIPLGKKTSNSSTLVGQVTLWGTLQGPDTIKAISEANGLNTDLSIRYVPKQESTYQQSLIEAFASGKGPDLFIITPDMILKNKDFIYPIPYASYPQKGFKDTFIDGADIYLGKEGVLGLPLVVDPIVLYYNKNIVSNAGMSKIPQYWDELAPLNDKLTIKKDDGTITQSMISLGQFDNVTHAKDILALLLLQSNNPIVQNFDNRFTSVLNENFNLQTSPIEAIMDFFTSFSNPSNTSYAWNRALLESKDMFTGGKLAFYPGFASELFTIQSINPNLSFDVDQIFQTKGTNTKRTYGQIYAIAVNKNSPNATLAFSVASLLVSDTVAKEISIGSSLPPASRSLLSSRPEDPYLFTFFNSAITSRSWRDPDSKATDQVFKEMVNNILSNRLSPSDSINKAHNQLDLIINPLQ